MNARIPVFRPTIQRRHMHAVLECLVSDDVGPGPLARQLIRQLGSQLGVTAGVALADTAAAIAAGLHSLGLARSDRILISALAPLRYVLVAEREGLIPLLVDVDPETGTMSMEALRRLMAAEPQALVLTHPLGQVEDGEALRELGIPVLEDVTQAFPPPSVGGDTAPTTGAVAGSFGDALVLSLGPSAAITAAGGAVVLARTRRRQRLLTQFVRASACAELPDLNAALALAQLRELAGLADRRRSMAETYLRALAGGRHRTLRGAAMTHSPFSFPVVVDGGLRDIRRYAAKHRIETLPAFGGCALQHVAAADPLDDELDVADDQGGDDGEEARQPAPAAEQLVAAATAPAPPAPPVNGDGAGGEGIGAQRLPRVLERQLHAAATPGTVATGAGDLAGARQLARQCILFPLYPALSENAVAQIVKVLATLP